MAEGGCTRWGVVRWERDREKSVTKVKVECDIMGEPNMSEQSSDAVSMERSLRRWRIRADETVSG